MHGLARGRGVAGWEGSVYGYDQTVLTHLSTSAERVVDGQRERERERNREILGALARSYTWPAAARK